MVNNYTCGLGETARGKFHRPVSTKLKQAVLWEIGQHENSISSKSIKGLYQTRRLNAGRGRGEEASFGTKKLCSADNCSTVQ